MEDSKSYATEFTTLVNAGVKLATYAHASIYIHAKVIVADYDTSSARVFVGSENFSNPSLTENRELGLITSDATLLTSLDATLTSDFAGGKPYQVADAAVSDDAATSNDSATSNDAATSD